MNRWRTVDITRLAERYDKMMRALRGDNDEEDVLMMAFGRIIIKMMLFIMKIIMIASILKR